MGIENIHAMRASLKAFLALMKPRSPHHAFAHGREDREEQGWLGELEKSGSVSHGDDPKPIAAEPIAHASPPCRWIEHVRGVLRAAVTVTRHVHIGRSSVLVHCSDGWDRTAQVTAIAQLLLDGSFRSRDGFQRLVQKEWLDFGHQVSPAPRSPPPVAASPRARPGGPLCIADAQDVLRGSPVCPAPRLARAAREGHAFAVRRAAVPRLSSVRRVRVAPVPANATGIRIQYVVPRGPSPPRACLRDGHVPVQLRAPACCA